MRFAQTSFSPIILTRTNPFRIFHHWLWYISVAVTEFLLVIMNSGRLSTFFLFPLILTIILCFTWVFMTDKYNQYNPGLYWLQSLRFQNNQYYLDHNLSSEVYSISENNNQVQQSSADYCYNTNPNTIIFLHLSNKSDKWLPLEMCAFKSAAVKNGENGVCVLTLTPMRLDPILQGLSNLHVSLLNISGLVEETPLKKWYSDRQSVGKDNKSHWNFVWDLSDALRYAYLYKYGGKYMDMDVITLKNLQQLRNVIGWQDGHQLNGAVSFFDKGHPFIKEALERFVKSFVPGSWGTVGPRLVTDIHHSAIVNSSSYTLFNKKAFYPTSYPQYRLPFLKGSKEEMKKMVNGSYTLHLWRYMLIKNNMWEDYVSPQNGSFIYEFLNDVCYNVR